MQTFLETPFLTCNFVVLFHHSQSKNKDWDQITSSAAPCLLSAEASYEQPFSQGLRSVRWPRARRFHRGKSDWAKWQNSCALITPRETCKTCNYWKDRTSTGRAPSPAGAQITVLCITSFLALTTLYPCCFKDQYKHKLQPDLVFSLTRFIQRLA